MHECAMLARITHFFGLIRSSLRLETVVPADGPPLPTCHNQPSSGTSVGSGVAGTTDGIGSVSLDLLPGFLAAGGGLFLLLEHTTFGLGDLCRPK